MSDFKLPPEATFAGCPKCRELMHLNHLDWVKAKDAALLAAESRATLAEKRKAELEEALRPFAQIQPTDTMPDGDKFCVVWDGSLLWADVDPKIIGAWSGVTAADLRRAVAALSKPKEA